MCCNYDCITNLAQFLYVGTYTTCWTLSIICGLYLVNFVTLRTNWTLKITWVSRMSWFDTSSTLTISRKSVCSSMISLLFIIRSRGLVMTSIFCTSLNAVFPFPIQDTRHPPLLSKRASVLYVVSVYWTLLHFFVQFNLIQFSKWKLFI